MGPYLNATGIGVWSQQPNFQRTPSITSLEVMWLISRPLYGPLPWSLSGMGTVAKGQQGAKSV